MQSFSFIPPEKKEKELRFKCHTVLPAYHDVINQVTAVMVTAVHSKMTVIPARSNFTGMTHVLCASFWINQPYPETQSIGLKERKHVFILTPSHQNILIYRRQTQSCILSLYAFTFQWEYICIKQ